MNPLKTVKSFEAYMRAHKGQSEQTIANDLWPHVQSGIRFMSLVDLIRTYREFVE